MVLVSRNLKPPIVFYRQNWSDTWQLLTDVEPLEVYVSTPSNDISRATFRRRYGEMLQPGATQFATRGPISLADYWIRIQYDFGDGVTADWKTIFIGRCEETIQEAYGRASVNDTPSGVQTFNAYGPGQILRKRYVSSSVWEADGNNTKTIGWIPPMNQLDERNALVGNRSDDLVDGNYQYSESNSIWTSRQYAEYLIDNFANDDDANNPTWEFTGDAITLVQDLTQLRTPIQFRDTQTLHEALTLVISRQAGFDWDIRYGGTDGAETFIIYVYSLAAEDATFGTRTLHANPNATTFSAFQNPDLDRAEFSETTSNKYGRIRILGDRVVVCSTFEYGGSSPTLSASWEPATETAYESGTGDGADTAEQHDDYRATDRFRDVFAHFRAIKSEELSSAFFPSVTDEGEIDFDNRAETQDSIRETLSWIPLQQGFDYSVDPPTDNTDGETNPPFLPPIAFLQRSTASTRTDPYLMAEVAETGRRPIAGRLGRSIAGNPKSFNCIGRIHGDESNGDGSGLSVFEHAGNDCLSKRYAVFDRSRLKRERSPISDGVLDISIPSAQLWVLAPNTVVGLDADGDPITSPSAGTVLRTDLDQLEQAMAGAIARYQAARFRGSVRVNGIWDVDDTIGSILQFTDDGTNVDSLKAPIVSVRWLFESDHKTELKTGYAL